MGNMTAKNASRAPTILFALRNVRLAGFPCLHLNASSGCQPQSDGYGGSESNGNAVIGFVQQIPFPPLPSCDPCDWGSRGHVASFEPRTHRRRPTPTRG